MEWTRTFVSGPVDPKWNRYKFYCQICKANISIYSKGASEILRHHSTEKHLKKDQRWRYEHLYKIDPYTKARIPQVRGRDGKLLTPFQLALELPKFQDVELVDIGKSAPFMMNTWPEPTTCLPHLRTVPAEIAEIALISCVMGAVSTGSEIISVTGCTSKTVQLLDDSPYGQYSLHCPPRFEELKLRTLMHKKNSSVFGHIDFFGVLHHLIVSLGLRTLGPEAGVGDAFS